MSKLVNLFLVRILIFKFIIRFPSQRRQKLVKTRLYIYKFMTLLPKDYYLILDNDAKNLLRPYYIYIYKFMTLLPKDYYLILDNDAKNLLRPYYIYIYKYMTLLPNDYYLIPGNGTTNLLQTKLYDAISVC